MTDISFVTDTLRYIEKNDIKTADTYRIYGDNFDMLTHL